MRHEALTEAATALSAILTSHGIQHAYFGGFAIIELCGGNHYRESKDIDCLAATSKEKALEIMEPHTDFLCIPQGRKDYVAFFWVNPTNKSESILCELFVGPKNTPVLPTPVMHTVRSAQFGAAELPLLPVGTLFKGKLNACASRSKPNDVVDILYMLALFPDEVRAAAKRLPYRTVLKAVGNYPNLELLFLQAGLKTHPGLGGRLLSSACCINLPRRMDEGEVHRGLGCDW